ncbi:MAG: MBL fold metallo-hydrolase [Acidimicrobiales bacterium]
MKVATDEIADGVYRLSLLLPDIGPDGMTVNSFILEADQPLLYHCGLASTFDDLAHAASRVVRPERLRWIGFGHLEADEAGAMNQWLAAAPSAQVMHGTIGCEVSLNDMALRLPMAMGDGSVLDIGTKRLRHIDTPHIPHGWDSRVLYEEVTGTLLCGDLLGHLGPGPALRDDDVVERSLATSDQFGDVCLTPSTAPTIRRLADLDPRTLAIMHGSCYDGRGRDALHALADGLEHHLLSTMP